MSQMTRGEFASQMAKLRAKYQNGIQDEALWLASVAEYWSVFKSCDADVLRSAFARAGKEFPNWMPSAGQLSSLTETSKKSDAIAAWPEVMQLARGSNDHHSDPIARESLRLMGGGKRLGQMPEKELETWGRKEFERIYLDLCERPQQTQPLLTSKSDPVVGEIIEGVADKLAMR